jgi:hypothetical protein
MNNHVTHSQDPLGQEPEFDLAPDFGAEYSEMLAYQTINQLRTIAKKRGIAVHGTRKDRIVEELASQLSDLDAVRAQIDSFDDTRKRLLSCLHLILTPGYGLDSGSIVDELFKRHKDTSRSLLHSHIVDLSQRGLLLTFKQRNLVYCSLPQAVRACLPPRTDLVAAYPAKQIAQLRVRETRASTSLQALYDVWNYLVEQRPTPHTAPARQPIEDQWPQLEGWNHLPGEIQELTRRRQPYYALTYESLTVPAADYGLRCVDRKAIREHTGRSDEEIEFWYALLKGLGAISENPGEPITVREQVFQKLLCVPPSAKMYAILYTWITNQNWSEIDVMLRTSQNIRLRRNLRYTTYKPSDMYQEWHTGRQTFIRFLSTLDQDRWLSINGFLKTIFEIAPNIIHIHADPAVWWFESLKTKKQFGTTFEDWEQSYGQFVLATLQGPLAWLGAISLGYKEGKLEAFKLTSVGSFALGRRTTLAENKQPVPPSNVVEMQDDLSIAFDPSRVPAQLHDLLHSIGTLEEATPEQFVYRITADGVLIALERGRTVENLLASLRRWCGTDVPDAWKKKLHTWSENYGKLHVYQDITLIELADDYALQELMANTSLRERIIYQFSPRLIAIRPSDIEILVGEMEKQGYTPRIK